MSTVSNSNNPLGALGRDTNIATPNTIGGFATNDSTTNDDTHHSGSVFERPPTQTYSPLVSCSIPNVSQSDPPVPSSFALGEPLAAPDDIDDELAIALSSVYDSIRMHPSTPATGSTIAATSILRTSTIGMMRPYGAGTTASGLSQSMAATSSSWNASTNFAPVRFRNTSSTDGSDEAPLTEVTPATGRWGTLLAALTTPSVGTILAVVTLLCLGAVAATALITSDLIYKWVVTDYIEAHAVANAQKFHSKIEARIQAAHDTQLSLRQLATMSRFMLPSAEAEALQAAKSHYVHRGSGIGFNDDTLEGSDEAIGLNTWRTQSVHGIYALVNGKAWVSSVTMQFMDGASLWYDATTRRAATQGPAVLENGTLVNDGVVSYLYFPSYTTLLFRRLPNSSLSTGAADFRSAEWFTRDMKRGLPSIVIKPFIGINNNIDGSNMPTLLTSFAGYFGSSAFYGRLKIDVDTSVLLKGILFTSSALEEHASFVITHGKVLAATGVDHLRTTTTFLESIPRTSITPEEEYIGCKMTNGDATAVCPYTIASVGYQPLLDAYLSARHLFEWSWASLPGARTSDPDMRLAIVPSDGRRYYACAMQLQVPDASMEWMFISIVNEPTLHANLRNARVIVLATVISVTIVAAVLVVVSARCILNPIGRVAQLMTEGAYLLDTDELGGDNPLQRKPSRLHEVRAIQLAYWTVCDELKILKAYIPDHLKPSYNYAAAEKWGVMSQVTKSSHAGGTSVVSLSRNSAVGHVAPGPSSVVEMTSMLPNFNEAKSFDAKLKVVEGNDDNNDDEVPQHDGESPIGNGPSVSNESSAEVELSEPKINPTPSSPANTLSAVSAASIHLHRITPLESGKVHEPKDVFSQVLPPPIFFADTCLIDREITVVHMNMIHFHQYARRKHPTSITSDYEAFITYMRLEVRRFGGVLESFMGDKMWVSFNATSKCTHHQVAAAYFAFHVTTSINKAALRYLESLASAAQSGKRASAKIDPRFGICRYGANCGVATGRAFVGPLGNSDIRRHNIISNAISEAFALERQSLRYDGCNAMIGDDMINAIAPYCEHVLVDVTLLPGSMGKRKRIACLKGPMMGAEADPSVTSQWLVKKPSDTAKDVFVYDLEMRHMPPVGKPSEEGGFFDLSAHNPLDELPCLPSLNRYRNVNSSFEAFLSGETELAREHISRSISESQERDTANTETQALFNDRRAVISYMAKLLGTFLDANVDGRQYQSVLGEAHLPQGRVLSLAATVRADPMHPPPRI